ncbi:hypothetical protein CU098_004282 [Rhizopus stolonifer]|uniref:BZIP domain-containing protein n=1 Tax=Rhizopus stolonifer TaxID=4846 RepID=A0A367ILZ8_RHIST|nr:hypothetical protein CU098_004282 [Rhizopus stolonifer]
MNPSFSANQKQEISRKRNSDAITSNNYNPENHLQAIIYKEAEETSESDDQDLKIRRKVQNRAAQRAFRERKERYVKELEKKIEYVQDSHVLATTKLYQENQHLRSIISHLELENNTLKGTHGASWLDTVPPPVSLPVLNSFPSIPLPPLKIRPAPVPDNKLKKSAQELTLKKKISVKIKSSDPPTQPVRTSATHSSLTFAITTPAILRSSQEAKNNQVELIQLYPDHCHPANRLLPNQKSSSPSYSSNSSCSSVTSSHNQEEIEDSSNKDGNVASFLNQSYFEDNHDWNMVFLN